MAPPRRDAVTVAQQMWALCARYPHERRPKVAAGRLIWVGRLQPTPLSVQYTVRVEYDQGRRPRVTVIDPPLQRHDGQQLPHVFPGDELCLYYDEFDGGQHLIADTVVPWISEWLFHYELWLSTGSWHGGGVHPGQGSTRRGRRRAEAEHTPRPDLQSSTG